MAHLIEVIGKILAEPDKIGEVFNDGNEIYFRFGTHSFSLIKRTSNFREWGEYSLYVYPTWKGSLDELARVFDVPGEPKPEMMAYNVVDMPEIRESLTVLYRVLEEKSLKIDEIFKDILNQ